MAAVGYDEHPAGRGRLIESGLDRWDCPVVFTHDRQDRHGETDQGWAKVEARPFLLVEPRHRIHVDLDWTHRCYGAFEQLVGGVGEVEGQTTPERPSRIRRVGVELCLHSILVPRLFGVTFHRGVHVSSDLPAFGGVDVGSHNRGSYKQTTQCCFGILRGKGCRHRSAVRVAKHHGLVQTESGHDNPVERRMGADAVVTRRSGGTRTGRVDQIPGQPVEQGLRKRIEVSGRHAGATRHSDDGKALANSPIADLRAITKPQLLHADLLTESIHCFSCPSRYVTKNVGIAQT